MRNIQASSLIAAAVLAALSTTAMAQYRVGDQGHANDANNRLGSGGYNQQSDISQRGLGATGTQILTGNVGGLGYFHGNSQTFDPNTLQTNTEDSASATLNAIAAPQNLSARTTGAPQNNITPFYSTAQVNQLPAPNYIQTPGGVGLVPNNAPQVQAPSDLRLGVIAPVTDQNQLPAPGQYNLPGQVDNSGQPQPLNASLLAGIRPGSVDDPTANAFLSRFSNSELQQQSRGAPLDNASIQRMRNELNSTIIDPNTGVQTTDDRTQTNSVNPGQPNPQGRTVNGAQVSNPELSQPGNAPMNASLSNQAMTANIGQSASVSGNLDTAQGTRQTLLTLPPPGQQSSQLAELEKRMAAQKGPISDQQANANYNDAMRLKREMDADKAKKAGGAAAPAAGAPGGQSDSSGIGNGPSAGSTASTGAKPAFVAPPTSTDKPAEKVTTPPLVNGPLAADQTGATNGDYVVTSLATGVKAAGLAKVMRGAETDMRTGKFTSALDSYDTAAAVAPNNPFVTLGRGFAELGASYYGKSENDLRRTFAAEPAVLVGRYDLKGFLGEDRVRFVTDDLRDIATSEKTSVRPLFLLAYIEHNLSDDQTATADLIEAQKRAGGNDATIAQMQKLWGLPTK